MHQEESVEQIPLMGGRDEDPDFRQGSGSSFPSITSTSTTNKRTDWLSAFLSTLVLSAFIVSLFSLFGSAAQFTRSTNAPLVDASRLRKPNVYIGLERVEELKAALALEGSPNESNMHHDSGSIGTFVLPPTLHRPSQIIQVNSDQPHRSYTADGWVLLSQGVHTILSFQTPRNATTCTIESYFPRQRHQGDKLLTLAFPGNPQTPHYPSLLKIDLLQSPSTAGSQSMTWESRPTIVKTIGSVTAEYGRNGTSPSFPCQPNSKESHAGPGASAVTVELSCASEDCRVEYRDASDSLPLLGVYLNTAIRN